MFNGLDLLRIWKEVDTFFLSYWFWKDEGNSEKRPLCFSSNISTYLCIYMQFAGKKEKKAAVIMMLLYVLLRRHPHFPQVLFNEIFPINRFYPSQVKLYVLRSEYSFGLDWCLLHPHSALLWVANNRFWLWMKATGKMMRTDFLFLSEFHLRVSKVG